MRYAARAVLALPFFALTVTEAGAQLALDIKEYPVPWERSRPRDPYMDKQGRVWFVGQTGNYIAYLSPESGEFKQYEIEEGTNPHNLIVDDEGIVWYAGNRNARIGRLDPATGAIKTFLMPDQAARDPHTLIFGAQGDIWFTVQGGNFVGRLNKTTGEVKLIASPVSGSRPYGIRVDPQGRPWIAMFGTNKLGTIDPATMQLRLIDIPRPDARPRRVDVTNDGKIWYVDYAGGFLGRYDPTTGEFKEWASPSGARAQPYAMAVDDQQRIWYVETGVSPNLFVVFDPNTEKFVSTTAIPSGGGAVRHMVFHEASGAVWFGTDTGNIGRAAIGKTSQ